MLLAVANQPEDVVVDGANIYFSDLSDNSVRTVPLAGGSVTILATNQASPRRLAVDGTYVYWTNYLGGYISRTREDGTGTPTPIAQANQPEDVAVDSTNVYWSEGKVMASPKDGGDGGAPTELLGVGMYGIPIDGAGAFGAKIANGVLYSVGTLCPVGCPIVFNIPIPLGTPTQLTNAALGISAISSNTIYSWGSSASTLSWYDFATTTRSLYNISNNNPQPIPPITASSCGLYYGLAEQLANPTHPPELLMLPHTGPTLFGSPTVLAMLTNPPWRMVYAGDYVVWTWHGTTGGGVSALKVPQ